MNAKWPKRPDAGTRARAAALSKRTRLRQRLDIVLVLGWLLTALLIFLAGSVLFAFGKRAGWFDEAAVQVVEDARILENLRTPGSQSTDAVMHNDERLYVAQSDGELHRYHPRNRTWSTVGAPLPGIANRKVEVLRSGNGLPEGDLRCRPVQGPTLRHLWNQSGWGRDL